MDQELYVLGMKLSLENPLARAQAACALGEHPMGYTELHALMHMLDDEDADVREAVVGALDRIRAVYPQALDELLEYATNEELPASTALAAYLVHVGTPVAIDAALPIIAGDAWGEDRLELLRRLATTEGLTNDRLRAILDEGPREDDYLHRTAAEILGMRGFAEGYGELFRCYGSDSLYDQFIARGPDGIRILCRAFPFRDGRGGEIAQRISERRRKTEAVVRELLADAASGGARTAIEVLGYWDEPRNAELLVQIAEDPWRQRHLRDEAVFALCQMEAPEALDLLIRTMLDREQLDLLRWECAYALGSIGKPDALDALDWVATNDPDMSLRRHARDAIGIIENPAAA